MCAIVDANVTHLVFGPRQSDAGKQILRWIQQKPGRLWSGGLLYKEMQDNSVEFRQWAVQAQLAQRIRILPEDEIQRKATRVKQDFDLCSEDSHVLAIALLSGARILFSDDQNLQQDFSNRNIISRPRGKLFPAQDGAGSDRRRKQLLSSAHQCAKTHR